MRYLVLSVLAIFATSCSPSTDAPAMGASTMVAAGGPETADAVQSKLASLSATIIGDDLHQAVQVRVEGFRVEGDWAFIKVLPLTTSGQFIDFATTPYADDAADDMIDGHGTSYLLFQRKPKTGWSKVEYALGPTDVAWENWPEQFGFPASLLEINQTSPKP